VKPPLQVDIRHGPRCGHPAHHHHDRVLADETGAASQASESRDGLTPRTDGRPRGAPAASGGVGGTGGMTEGALTAGAAAGALGAGRTQPAVTRTRASAEQKFPSRHEPGMGTLRSTAELCAENGPVRDQGSCKQMARSLSYWPVRSRA
jgi:hypothetical protein